MAEELLNCPFCGGKPTVYPKRPEIEGDGFGQVRCENDGCPANPVVNAHDLTGHQEETSENYKAASIAAWNRRAALRSTEAGNAMPTIEDCHKLAATVGMRFVPYTLSEPSTRPDREAEENGWRTMDSAPLDGKHCILAVKSDVFVWSVQGAYDGRQWNCVIGDNVKPLYWMPNVRLPEGWEAALAKEGK